MLIAQNGTRPDGAWFFSDTHYAGSLGIKFYGENIKKSMHQSNKTSSDLRCCFMAKDVSEKAKSLAAIRQESVIGGTPAILKGILRIHIEFPGVSGGNPITYVKSDLSTNSEDIMVYINSTNMDSFFFEGIQEHLDDVVKLKTLIKFIST